MLRLVSNRRLWLVVLVIGGLLSVALWPKTVPVDVVSLARGPLRVTVDEEGKTRVRDRFVVAAPVAGRVLRIELEPGDAVRAGDVIARMRPESPTFLDTRSRAEAEATLESARAAVGRAKADEDRARAALAQAQREQTRARALVNEGLATAQQLDAREADVKSADEQVNAAVFSSRAAASDVERARVRLAVPTAHDGDTRVVPVTAPVAGVVLKRLRESESIVPAGEPLLEIGDPHQLEIVADLLSVDAVRVSIGARVLVEQWGGDHSLEARVHRIEPSGFTKVSALGVEEQRVNLILEFTDSTDAWRALGDGYRVQVRTILWESADVLKAPTGALVRAGEAWAVYVVSNGRAHQTLVTLGHQNGQEAEIVSGLEAGMTVIVHPGDTIAEGVRVAPRVP